MRRFATWCTGHRKTVILSWIVALIGVGFAAGKAGSAFSENFKLPSSDSQRAVDLLEKRFPAQSGETSTIVFQAPRGIESPSVKQKMSAAFAAIEQVPHVSEVSSPYAGGGAGAISENGKIAYATVQFDEQGRKIGKENVEKVMDLAQGAAGSGLQVELGGQPIEEVRQEEGDTSFLIGLLAAVVILLFTFGSVVAMGLPLLTALFALGVGLSLVTLGTHVFDTADFATQLAAMIGLGVGIDYALFILTRFRNGLDEGLEPQAAAIKAIDTAGRAVLFAGLTVIISLMGMLLLGVTFLYGVAVAAALAVLMTMISLADPAAGTARDRRAPDRSAAHSGSRQAPSLERNRAQPLVPVEHHDPAPPGGRDAALGRLAGDPLHPGSLLAAGFQRRRKRSGRHDHAQGIRPACRRLRPRLQRAVPGGGGTAETR
jgi:RND superfamily putative drug exporter